MAGELAKLVVRLEAQSAQYQAGLEKATRQLNKFQRGQSAMLKKVESGFASLGRRVLSIGAAYAAVSAISESIKFGDDMAKAAEKSGIAAESFTQLAHAAKMSDVDLNGLSTGLKKMQVTLSQAGSGMATAQQTIAALGLTVEQVFALKPDEQFELLADRISKLANPADKTRAAVELFGKAGADLLPMFEQGAAGIRAGREEAIDLGRSLTAVDLAKLQQADDAIKRMKASVDSLSTSFAMMAAGPITTVANSIRFMLGGATEAEKLQSDVNVSKLILDNMTAIAKKGPAGTVALEAYAKALQRLSDFNTTKFLSGISGATGDLVPPGFGSLVEKMKELAPVTVTADKILTDFGAMLRETETDAQAASRAYDIFLGKLKQLQGAGLIGAAEFNKRLAEFMDKAIPEVEVTAKKMQVEKALSEMTVFADQAARNMESAFADFLFDPFDKGIKGMLRGFVDILRRMTANAAASQIFNALSAQSGSGGVLGWLGGLIGAGASSSGSTIGTRASGGPVSSGKPYVVGEAGPELFVPGHSGVIVPNGAGITINQPIDARGATMELARALPGILSENNRRLVDSLRDAKTRGAF